MAFDLDVTDCPARLGRIRSGSRIEAECGSLGASIVALCLDGAVQNFRLRRFKRGLCGQRDWHMLCTEALIA